MVLAQDGRVVIVDYRADNAATTRKALSAYDRCAAVFAGNSWR